ncbi:trafficking protein particle complex subunit 9-like [Vicugna pacos]|uniref:Trafficking protein particle complex subunit 9-like n=2 Tax=Vicugna pacos TaxID=30538 RepID=A0ABM5CZQ0_VICPA
MGLDTDSRVLCIVGLHSIPGNFSKTSAHQRALLPASGAQGHGMVGADCTAVKTAELVTAGALTSSGIHPDTSTDTGRAQNCLSPEDTSDKWKGAAPCYSSVRMPVTQLEACIQAVLPCHHHLEAVPESSEFLQNVVYNHLEQVPPL